MIELVEVKISSKMKKGIKLVEKTLGIKYSGSSFSDAKKFLDDNLSKLSDVDFMKLKEPTDKQLKGIKFIEGILHVEFTGSTMRDANDFISEYLDEAKHKVEARKR